MQSVRIALLSGLFAAVVGGQAYSQDIAGSPHDLSSGDALQEDNNEICVYCHTPHGARTDIEAPLWNKPAATTTYDSYDSTTIDGTILAVGSVSVACLTCHDGTQAVDAVINAPGTGLGDGFIGASDGVTNTTIGSGIANLGTDLTNDHPIGVRYGGGDGTLAATDPDFVTAQTATINSSPAWWVDTSVGTAATREKTDMILYTRDNAGTAEPFVECASCHDPHEGAVADADTNTAGSDVSFMRISNANSDVCLACHVK